MRSREFQIDEESAFYLHNLEDREPSVSNSGIILVGTNMATDRH
jgi:hypothetical protein